jgi:hypothetical protein
LLWFVFVLGLSGCGRFGGNEPGGDNPGGGTPDTTAPANVTGLAGTPGNGQVTLAWTDPVDADLASIEITWDPDGAALRTVNKGTGTYTAKGLANSTPYTFTVKAVDAAKNMSTGETVATTPVAPGTLVDDEDAQKGPNIKLKFEGSKDKTGTPGVKAAFEELSAYIKTGGLDNAASNVIQLGNYIDLEGGLEVKDYGAGGGGFKSSDDWNSTITIANTNRGTLSRLIVVGINSFHSKRGVKADGTPTYNGDEGGQYTIEANDGTPHVVFQFQNIPVERQMNATETNNGGYEASEMQKYLSGPFLPGLLEAGVPEDVLWPPARKVSARLNISTPADPAEIKDKLWLPTEREMTGKRSNSLSDEDGENQARLEFYADPNSRHKFDASQTDAKEYWLASQTGATFCAANTITTSSSRIASILLGVAPAFCVQGWIQPQP